jgi:hypothetical protein
MCALVMMASAAFAADPGLQFPAASELSDQKAGSVLFYVFLQLEHHFTKSDQHKAESHEHEHNLGCLRAPFLCGFGLLSCRSLHVSDS